VYCMVHAHPIHAAMSKTTEHRAATLTATQLESTVSNGGVEIAVAKPTLS